MRSKQSNASNAKHATEIPGRPGARRPCQSANWIVGVDPQSSRVGVAALNRATWKLGRFELLAVSMTITDPARRVIALGEQLEQWLCAIQPEAVAVETTRGIGRRRSSGGAGLVVYGMAVGYLWRCVLAVVDRSRVFAVPADAWTKGRTKSSTYRQSVARGHEAYRRYADAGRDPTGDVADAIGLASWLAVRDFWAEGADVSETSRAKRTRATVR